MRRVTITNTGTNAITLTNQDASSLAANRFIIPGVSGKVIPRNRERPETKKGKASDVGMLGTKRESSFVGAA